MDDASGSHADLAAKLAASDALKPAGVLFRKAHLDGVGVAG